MLSLICNSAHHNMSVDYRFGVYSVYSRFVLFFQVLQPMKEPEADEEPGCRSCARSQDRRGGALDCGQEETCKPV